MDLSGDALSIFICGVVAGCLGVAATVSACVPIACPAGAAKCHSACPPCCGRCCGAEEADLGYAPPGTGLPKWPTGVAAEDSGVPPSSPSSPFHSPLARRGSANFDRGDRRRSTSFRPWAGLPPALSASPGSTGTASFVIRASAGVPGSPGFGAPSPGGGAGWPAPGAAAPGVAAAAAAAAATPAYASLAASLNATVAVEELPAAPVAARAPAAAGAPAPAPAPKPALPLRAAPPARGRAVAVAAAAGALRRPPSASVAATILQRVYRGYLVRRVLRGWALVSDDGPEPYYHHRVSGAVAWELPPIPGADKRTLPPGWTRQTDGKQVWYVHTASGESSWDFPGDTPAAERDSW
jgi:hypothetical protein